MANAKRDENYVPSLLGVSSVDGVTTVPIYADPVTHRLLVNTVVTNATPQVTYLTSGSGTYTTPAGARYLFVQMQGPGSGGSGSGTTPGAVTASASDTTFGTAFLVAGKGAAPSTITGGIGGTATGGDINIPGQNGGNAPNGYTFAVGGVGGGPVGGMTAPSQAGGSPPANSGCGGGGAGADSAASPGAGGAQGGYLEAIIGTPLASYAYNIGPASTGGTAGTGGQAGGTGAAGYIIVVAYF